MRCISLNSHKNSGFTLVEIMVVAPLVILIIGGMITAMIALSTGAMRSSAHSQLQHEVLTALDQIEQDVKLSIDFNTDTIANTDTTPNKLSLRSLATDKNPFNADRKLIKASDCTAASGGIFPTDALKYKMQYYVESNNVLRRKAVFDSGCDSSDVPWQRAIDEKLISTNNEIILKITGTEANAKTIQLTVTKTVAGRDISYTGYLYVKSVNF